MLKILKVVKMKTGEVEIMQCDKCNGLIGVDTDYLDKIGKFLCPCCGVKQEAGDPADIDNSWEATAEYNKQL